MAGDLCTRIIERASEASATNPYEAAVKWIENEVFTHGVFEVRRSEGNSYDHASGITTQVPTGKLTGFTVSSQRTPGCDYNLLQLVTTMKLQASPGQASNTLQTDKKSKNRMDKAMKVLQRQADNRLQKRFQKWKKNQVKTKTK